MLMLFISDGYAELPDFQNLAVLKKIIYNKKINSFIIKIE
jgi:hypothetical protein